MASLSFMFKLVFTLTVMLTLVLLVLIPAPLKPLLFDTYLPPQYYKLAANGKEYSYYTVPGASKLNKRNLLVWFTGSGFLYSDRKTTVSLL